MNKTLSIIGLLILLLVAGYACYRLGILPIGPRVAAIPTSTLTLENLPATSCPETAQIVLWRNRAIAADTQLAVQQCRSINFQRFLTAKTATTTVYVKLPGALAFSVVWPPASGQPFAYAPALGDVNNDNSIDSTDGQLVTAALFTSGANSPLDVDGDGIISVTDLSLVRLNQGVGVSRPDGAKWSSH